MSWQARPLIHGAASGAVSVVGPNPKREKACLAAAMREGVDALLERLGWNGMNAVGRSSLRRAEAPR